MPLTDIEIRSAKPGDKDFKLSDGGWLFLMVTTSGSKLWRMAYRFAGKEKTLSLGKYPESSLKDARANRDAAKALLASGIDPGQHKKLEKLTKAHNSATTFRLLSEEFLAKQKREGRAAATLEKNRWLLEFAFPTLGERPIAEIKAPEVLAVLRGLKRAEGWKRRDACGRISERFFATLLLRLARKTTRQSRSKAP